MASIEHDGLDEPLLQIQEGHSRGSPGETEATHEDGLSWSESVKQRENNYARMCMLINREGARVLREYTKKNIISQKRELGEILKEKRIKKEFDGLKKKRALNSYQYEILYPKPGTKFQEDKVDISLWVIVARYLIRQETYIAWDEEPGPEDNLWGHHMLRIRNTRNKLSHVSTNELTNSEFEAMWTGLVPSLIVFGSSKAEILQMKTCDLDPLNTKLWVNEVQLQDLRHQNEKAESRAAHKHKALCVLVALLILAIVAIFLTYFLIFKDPGPCSQYLLKWATNEAIMYYMPRYGWRAKPSHKTDEEPFHGPVDYLVVTETAINDDCSSHEECCLSVRTAQEYDMEIGFADIAFSYLIGGDGVIYEDRGQDYIPATVKNWNDKVLSIAFVGYFSTNSPSHAALNAGPILIQYLVDNGALSHNTTVLGLCQMRPPFPNSPGAAIMQAMKDWRGNGWTWVSTREFSINP